MTEPKVVDVRVEDYNGWFDHAVATVTTEDGKAATAYGSTKEDAIERAARYAQAKSR